MVARGLGGAANAQPGLRSGLGKSRTPPAGQGTRAWKRWTAGRSTRLPRSRGIRVGNGPEPPV